MRKVYLLFINLFILFVSIMFFVFFIGSLIEANYEVEDLCFHEGAVESLTISSFKYDEEEKPAMMIKLVNNDTVFFAYRFVKYIGNYLNAGDTVQIYTKDLKMPWGYIISDETGSVWTTRQPNQIFHLVSKTHDNLIIDLAKNKKNIFIAAIFSLIASLAFLFWFLYRISGKKSMFIIEDYE